MNEISTGVMNYLFGCRHGNVTRPFTRQRRTYKVCLDCGQELGYSLATMSYARMRPAMPAPALTPARANVISFVPRVVPVAAEADTSTRAA